MIPAAVLALSASLFLPLQAGEDRADLDRLQGQWTLLQTADAKHVDSGADDIRMVITNKTITMLFGRLETNWGTMVLGQANGAKTIDMRFGNGRTVLGIYELAGDMLTICVADAGNSRPERLAPTRRQWLEKWKRVQPRNE
jgi:uncharacterized protein (TIGR03067 family)